MWSSFEIEYSVFKEDATRQPRPHFSHLPWEKHKWNDCINQPVLRSDMFFPGQTRENGRGFPIIFLIGTDYRQVLTLPKEGFGGKLPTCSSEANYYSITNQRARIIWCIVSVDVEPFPGSCESSNITHINI